MQVKVSPPPTQVPPLEHGLEAHVLFLAGRANENVSERERGSQSLRRNTAQTYCCHPKTILLHSILVRQFGLQMHSDPYLIKLLLFVFATCDFEQK